MLSFARRNETASLDEKLAGFVTCASTATVSDELIAEVRACDLSAIFTELENYMKKRVAEKNSQ